MACWQIPPKPLPIMMASRSQLVPVHVLLVVILWLFVVADVNVETTVAAVDI